ASELVLYVARSLPVPVDEVSTRALASRPFVKVGAVPNWMRVNAPEFPPRLSPRYSVVAPAPSERVLNDRIVLFEPVAETVSTLDVAAVRVSVPPARSRTLPPELPSSLNSLPVRVTAALSLRRSLLIAAELSRMIVLPARTKE